jgi:hypothetical protein
MMTTILRTTFVMLAAGALAACDGGTAPEPPSPAAVQVLSGNDQEGTAGSVLADSLVVRVADAGGRPLAGRTVTFAVTAGAGQVPAGGIVTDAEGRARAPWVLGPSTADSQRVEARVAGRGGAVLAATFRATPRAGPAAGVAAVGDTSFSAITGAVLGTPLRVRVVDALGNPVPGAAVQWRVLWGGGSLPVSSVADAAGEATATWSLGTLAHDPQRAEARAGGALVAFSAATLPPANVVVVAEESGHSGPAGTSIGDLWLRVRLPDGRGVWGARVEWSGDGMLRSSTTTDGQGTAHNAWTATRIGTVTARATIATAGAPVSVEWTGTGTPNLPYLLHPAEPIPAEQVAGRPTQPGVRVRVTDADGFIPLGVTVGWGVMEGGGTISAETSVSDAQGFASVEWTMGPPGPQELRAWIEGGPLDWLTLVATSVPGTP